MAIIFAIILTLGLLYPVFGNAQAVQQQGKTFVQQPKQKQAEKLQPSGYTYKTTDGKTYIIYISKNGNAFILRTSKKGNTYRQYLPEITAKLGKKD